MKLFKVFCLSTFFLLLLNTTLGFSAKNNSHFSTKTISPVEKKKPLKGKKKYKLQQKKENEIKNNSKTPKTSTLIIVEILLIIILIIGAFLTILGFPINLFIIFGIIIISLSNLINILLLFLEPYLNESVKDKLWGKDDQPRIGAILYLVFFCISFGLGIFFLIWGIFLQFSFFWIFGIVLMSIPILMLLFYIIRMIISSIL